MTSRKHLQIQHQRAQPISFCLPEHICCPFEPSH